MNGSERNASLMFQPQVAGLHAGLELMRQYDNEGWKNSRAKPHFEPPYCAFSSTSLSGKSQCASRISKRRCSSFLYVA